ncbi:MAG: Lytic transglycosylase [Candidatus Tokpelaia sp. JSC085]|nr:MAG: Lytic transglycosylase [Candidatus Tokpelaia sp. JSC085]
MKCLVLSVVVLLAGCARTPTQISNICAVLSQNDGPVFNWQRSSKRAEQKYGIPMPIILATIYAESGFQQRAKPPRKKLLGLIPWKRLSTAYGYSQAVNGTWKEYRRKTGHKTACRTSFDDAAQFIAWFHRESIRKNAISPNDVYGLYLNYHMGHRAYARGSHSAFAIQKAQQVQMMAQRYAIQLRNCGRW